MPSRKSDHGALRKYKPSQRAPAFWDSLLKIYLTKSALQELDRRNDSLLTSRTRTSRSDVIFAPDFLSTRTPSGLEKIKRLSRHGGPHTTDLRDYPPPSGPAYTFIPNRSHTKASSPRETMRDITAYSRNFEQHIIDHGIYLVGYGYGYHDDTESTGVEESTGLGEPAEPPEPANLDDISQPLSQRPHLPLNLTRKDFLEFRRASQRAKKEHQVLKDVVPIIEGKASDKHHSSGRYPFKNLAPLTDGTLAPAKPDIFYGAYPQQLNPHVRNELEDKIIPSTENSLPAIPNFFFEVKGLDGSMAVCLRQACYDGALGARAMQALQSFQGNPVYDGNAYTITATFGGGTLTLYAHHPVEPKSPGDRPEYFMTDLGAWAMNGSFQTFEEGVIAYRNARQWAKEKRNEFIAAANNKWQASQTSNSSEEIAPGVPTRK
ncbi:hypothetical protein P170DRAFT_474447 [Aspergillus steynii IBT 23096]|uniref:Uncharacterized protein n=1 Tax=Aspergillus steynii IBT 23096 TaxID=1392250 RepID=A0A2I2GDC4_9EURO|nr:uncharacterized protein P170DRAFT_474447 [Aspergillus steynii IBT 23096]PLB50898.1 hypothetical protein P170DRAFT_474447 [Aspergillus steynii IBT 23096]